ncbi:MAG: hypothetical protein ACYTXT_38075 [Nostoc sp.]
MDVRLNREIAPWSEGGEQAVQETSTYDVESAVQSWGLALCTIKLGSFMVSTLLRSIFYRRSEYTVATALG